MTFGADQRWTRRTRRIVTTVFAVAWLLALTAFLSELFLVGLAERRVTSTLERDGTGVAVRIAARPAIELLAGRASDVVVHIGSLRPRAKAGDGAHGLADLLAGTGATGSLDARIDLLASPRLTLHDVHLVKHGAVLTATATVTRAAIRAALPQGMALSRRKGAEALELTAKVPAIGRRVRATIDTRAGRLVIAPRLGGIAVLTIAVFADPRVSIDRVGARATSDGYDLEARGHLT